jgi:hypothetical protein
MRGVPRAILLVLAASFLYTGCEDPTSSSPEDTSVYVTMSHDSFTSSNIDLLVTVGDTSVSNYTGTYVIYSENFLDLADGISLHFMVPDSSGSMLLPGPQWLIIKIQKDSMVPGVYTLDDTDQNYQLSRPGQVKLYYNDADNVKHVGSGEITINTLDWSNSGDDTASLRVDLSLTGVTLGAGLASSVAGASALVNGSVGGTFQGEAAISANNPGLVGTRWRGTWYYYDVPVVETLHFTSSSSCTGTVEADGQSTTVTMSYTYSPSSRTGTLTADSTKPFSIDSSFTMLTFNGVIYHKQ